MKRDPFKYIFRFCCDPGFNDQEEIRAMSRYADEADIDDVAVFANVEEINTGHMSFQEQDTYLAMMTQLKDVLAEKGVTISINQWHSVMHADLGKRFRPDQGFRPMVDVEGNEAALCVCPLCSQWQDYIGRLYARYAQLEPSILWVEDDFRLHNHDPLVWGGCFCREHMKLYSQRAGKKLSREEFLAGVLKPGEPHPYRKIWLDVARETMISAARSINKAVRQVTDKSKIGLMTSAPHIHAAEGRDWHLLLNTLAEGNAPVDRIHLPGYQENSPAVYMQGLNMVSMMTRAMIPQETEVYPELENYPYSLFSKSRRFTRFQLLSALPLNLAGITLDLYDLNGNGIIWEEDYQTMLHQTKPYLNGLTARGTFRGKQLGVQVLYSQDSAYTIHTKRGSSMEELYPQEVFFAGLLPAMGVPCVYCSDPHIQGQILAVSGQALRNWDTETLETLFANNFVILNGDAVETLCDMGLGHLAGVEAVEWMKQDSGAYTYEQVTNGQTYFGRKNARASAVVLSSDVLKIRYRQDAAVQEYTAMYNSFRERTAPGETVVNGRVMVYPFGHFAHATHIPAMLLNSLRQCILQQILQDAGAAFPMVAQAPNVQPYCFWQGGRTEVYLVNGSTDDAVSVKLILPAQVPDHVWTWGSWEKEGGDHSCEQAGSGMVLHQKIPSMEALLLTLPGCGKEEAVE